MRFVGVYKCNVGALLCSLKIDQAIACGKNLIWCAHAFLLYQDMIWYSGFAFAHQIWFVLQDWSNVSLVSQYYVRMDFFLIRIWLSRMVEHVFCTCIICAHLPHTMRDIFSHTMLLSYKWLCDQRMRQWQCFLFILVFLEIC